MKLDNGTYLSTLETMVMSTICVCENTVLILQTAITTNGSVLDGSKSTPQLGAKRSCDPWKEGKKEIRYIKGYNDGKNILVADGDGLNIVVEDGILNMLSSPALCETMMRPTRFDSGKSGNSICVCCVLVATSESVRVHCKLRSLSQ